MEKNEASIVKSAKKWFDYLAKQWPDKLLQLLA
jgi:hypothetical protein